MSEFKLTHPTLLRSASSLDQLLVSLQTYLRNRGIRVVLRPMPLERPAEFDGLSVTLNREHDVESCCYYLAHSWGSIVGWSLARTRVRTIFDELRRAKASRDTEAIERALVPFQAFEERSSEYAVWTLHELGYSEAVRSFTEFFRADMEAITALHRHGRAPVWPTFLATWKAEIASGTRTVSAFEPRAVPLFVPIEIEKQEVTQERGQGLSRSNIRF